MTKWTKRAWFVAISLVLLALIVHFVVPPKVEQSLNSIVPHQPYVISKRAAELHGSLVIGDLHGDSLAWDRDLLERSDRGHFDIPRMREGNGALQMFTTVTKSPLNLGTGKSTADGWDTSTLGAVLQAWPIATWGSLTARALHQAAKLQAMADRAPDQIVLVLSAEDLEKLLARRAAGASVVGGLLGTEGSHALDKNLENIQLLYDAGFRMMSLQHLFDNALGASLEGAGEDRGLSNFGRLAVDKMLSLGIIIDVSHSAPRVVQDVLARSHAPLIISHTGFYGHCQSERNISDELMQKITAAGGLIGVGFWKAAICNVTPQGIVASIRYGIDLVGEDYVALGSDFDGSVEVPFDISELAVLTDEMLKADFTETEIRKVMGENMMRFLRQNLPKGRQHEP